MESGSGKTERREEASQDDFNQRLFLGSVRDDLTNNTLDPTLSLYRDNPRRKQAINDADDLANGSSDQGLSLHRDSQPGKRRLYSRDDFTNGDFSLDLSFDSYSSRPAHVGGQENSSMQNAFEVSENAVVNAADLELRQSHPGKHKERTIRECQLCFTETGIRRRMCCKLSVCDNCMTRHVYTTFTQMFTDIQCPRCPHRMTQKEILICLPTSLLRASYGRYLVRINRDQRVKTCPRCNNITFLKSGEQTSGSANHEGKQERKGEMKTKEDEEETGKKSAEEKKTQQKKDEQKRKKKDKDASMNSTHENDKKRKAESKMKSEGKKKDDENKDGKKNEGEKELQETKTQDMMTKTKEEKKEETGKEEQKKEAKMLKGRTNERLKGKTTLSMDPQRKTPREDEFQEGRQLTQSSNKATEKEKSEDQRNDAITCDKCGLLWCFPCHAPWHENLTCGEFNQADTSLLLWAAERNEDPKFYQRNAQRCPTCKVFVQKRGGCSTINCICGSSFCYECGKENCTYFRRAYLGSHQPYLQGPVASNRQRVGRVLLKGTLLLGGAAVTVVAGLAVITFSPVLLTGYCLWRLLHYRRKQRRLRDREDWL